MRHMNTVFLRLLLNLVSSPSLRRKQRPSQRRDRMRHIATCCDESSSAATNASVKTRFAYEGTACRQNHSWQSVSLRHCKAHEIRSPFVKHGPESHVDIACPF